MVNTSYIAQAFRLQDGQLVAEPSLPFGERRSAVSVALRLSKSKDGVVAFAQNPGEAQNASSRTLVLRIGKLPPDC
jgi:hypothetical protein